MGSVFISQVKYDPHPGKYSFDNWNRAIEKDEPDAKRIIGHLAKGNLYAFMNTLLEFQYSSEAGMYVPVKKHRLNR